MHTPQIIMIVLSSLGLLSAANQPGKNGSNFWVTVLATAITFSLLIWGGFFSH